MNQNNTPQGSRNGKISRNGKAADANTCSPGAGRKDRRRALRRCEKTIRRYEQSSLEAGAALKEVRDDELFDLEGYDGFKAYVEATCTFDYPRALQLIRGAESLEILRAAEVDPLPTNEAQVRPLATHDAETQVAAWKGALEQAAGGRPPSKRLVRDVIDVVSGRAARRHADLTREWPREAVRRVARLGEAERLAVVTRVNGRVEEARAVPEADRDVFERAAADGVTLELVELVTEAYGAEIAESGLDHDPVLAGAAAEATVSEAADETAATDEAAADGSSDEAAADDATDAARQIVSKGYRTLVVPGVDRPLLVEVPRTVVPASILRAVPEAARTVIVELGELERRGGPVDNGVLRIQEIRDAARALGLLAVMNETNEAVDWARWTSNMLTGCLHACAGVFCYAASLANYLFVQRFTPTLYPVRLDHFANTDLPDVSGLPRDEACRARSAFSTSMGDLFGAWVPAWYVELVLEEVREHPEWFVFFLTKNARRLKDFSFPANCAVGATITGEDKYLVGCDGAYVRHSPTASEQGAYYRGLAADLAAVEGAAFTWLSLEPFRSEVHTLAPFFEAGGEMVAIGGQSRTAVCPAEQPEPRWVERVRAEVRAAGVALFEKENLAARPKEIPFPDTWLRDAQ